MNIQPTFEEFVKLSEDYNLLPMYLEMPADLETPISLLYKVFDGEEHIFLLESMEGPEKWARYSFIGFDPMLVFCAKGSEVILWQVETETFSCQNPFLELKKVWQRFRVPTLSDLPRFYGGLVGYVAYEVASFFERRVPRGEKILGFHDLYFVLPRKLIVYDRLKHTYKLITLVEVSSERLWDEYQRSRDEILALRNELLSRRAMPKPLQVNLKLSPEMDRSNFENMVVGTKEYIKRGDVIQVVLSQRFLGEVEILKDPHLSLYLYRALRKVNPSPYMFYLKFGEEALIGASPEILVRAEGRKVETRPIAGTRRRGNTEEEDLWLEKDLKSDDKELAEHIMLVDLGRNDLGRVCEYGSVEVYDLMVVERYSHVMHLVSGVKGILKEGEDLFSLFKACFPAGTVSGAPKVRAMEIIAELERWERGPYAGAVGYFGFNNTMDFCITIRTFFQRGKKLYLQAGAGIVADSHPRREYEETLNKAKALEKALELFSSGYFL